MGRSNSTITSKLKKYSSKRNFTQTPEPKPEKKIKTNNKQKTKVKKTKSEKSPTKKHIFVIQKHDASHLHYDFRLEIGKVLVSWAVPKGPSTDPRVKRLAIMTEDHPLSYADFEGVIPEGNYGAGTVMVWDYGTYENIQEAKNGKHFSMQTCLKKGRIEVWLHGKKLEGGYALVRTKGFGGVDDDKQWLLIKMKDEKADARRNPVNSEKKSALSKRTMHEIAKVRTYG